MDCFLEREGKRVHDPLFLDNEKKINKRVVWVPGPVIVGAGPSGLAVAGCLRERGVPSVVLERSNCIASLWQLKTYDRLRLHLPKNFCELPLMPFPENFPTYPSKQQFVSYLESYAKKFDINPIFRANVEKARFDSELGLWRISCEVGLVKNDEDHQCTKSHQNSVIKKNNNGNKKREESHDEETTSVEYLCRWLVVATGENAEAVVPEIEGTGEFRGGGGTIVHTSLYKSGDAYGGKKVLVVGCGNSGMEVCLDLCNFNARPSLVVRDTVHVLPREMLGKSTFGLSMWLLKWLPMPLVDRLLLVVSWLLLGDTSQLGLVRPKLGPLQLKNLSGKTPVLDVGTLAKIRSGDIKVCPGIRRLRRRGVEFVDGSIEHFDSIILATGYKSNVPYWLKEEDMFSDVDGLPRRPFPNGWKGESGLYAVGFTKRGLLGASMDAKRISEDIERCWKAESKHLTALFHQT